MVRTTVRQNKNECPAGKSSRKHTQERRNTPVGYDARSVFPAGDSTPKTHRPNVFRHTFTRESITFLLCEKQAQGT